MTRSTIVSGLAAAALAMAGAAAHAYAQEEAESPETDTNRPYDASARQGYMQMDTDGSQMVSYEEWAAWQAGTEEDEARFAAYDLNADGQLDWHEFRSSTSQIYPHRPE